MTEISPKTFVEAVHDKFSNFHKCEADTEIFVFLPKTAPGKKSDGSIHVPPELVLNGTGIIRAGNPDEIEATCNKIVSLDLEDNCITDIQEVAVILKGSPLCSFLNLRGNPLGNVEKDSLPEPLNQITKLVLNDVPLTWESFFNILKVFPSVSELHVSRVGYDCVDISSSGQSVYPSVTILHVANNFVTDWNEVRKLGKLFPNLQHLNLLKNPIKNLPMSKDLGVGFGSLLYINLSETELAQWAELEQFRYFPSLTNIKIVSIPLFEECTEDLRHTLTLAYLPNITILNGGRVLEEDKVNAERAFIRHFMGKENKPERYLELHQKYGDLEPLVDVNLGYVSNTETTITVMHNDKTILKTVQMQWTLADLRNEIRKWFNIQEDQRFKIWHEKGGCLATEPMKFPKRTLLRYNVNNGDQFYVERCES